MEKKITLKEFFESKEELCIHCDTEEKANTLLKAFHKMGKKWCGGKSYLKDNLWRAERENTVYYNKGTYGDTDYSKKHNYTIYEFEEVDLQDKKNLEKLKKIEHTIVEDGLDIEGLKNIRKKLYRFNDYDLNNEEWAIKHSLLNHIRELLADERS